MGGSKLPSKTSLNTFWKDRRKKDIRAPRQSKFSKVGRRRRRIAPPGRPAAGGAAAGRAGRLPLHAGARWQQVLGGLSTCCHWHLSSQRRRAAAGGAG
jgi:hypothetical protein